MKGKEKFGLLGNLDSSQIEEMRRRVGPQIKLLAPSVPDEGGRTPSPHLELVSQLTSQENRFWASYNPHLRTMIGGGIVIKSNYLAQVAQQILDSMLTNYTYMDHIANCTQVLEGVTAGKDLSQMVARSLTLLSGLNRTLNPERKRGWNPFDKGPNPEWLTLASLKALDPWRELISYSAQHAPEVREIISDNKPRRKTRAALENLSNGLTDTTLWNNLRRSAEKYNANLGNEQEIIQASGAMNASAAEIFSQVSLHQNISQETDSFAASAQRLGQVLEQAPEINDALQSYLDKIAQAMITGGAAQAVYQADRAAAIEQPTRALVAGLIPILAIKGLATTLSRVSLLNGFVAANILKAMGIQEGLVGLHDDPEYVLKQMLEARNNRRLSLPE